MSQVGGSAGTILSAANNGGGVSSMDAPIPKEELDSKLQEAREQLNQLRRQQEELERQLGELEELRRKQEEYSRGKTEMIESLTRGLATLEHEQVRAQRATELCRETYAAFRDYLDQLHALNDASWTNANLRSELAKALGVIDNSRMEYNRAKSRLECFSPAATEDVSTGGSEKKQQLQEGELFRYVCIGAAASAPLILAGTIWVILMLVFKR